jgi:hypothetical protein
MGNKGTVFYEKEGELPLSEADFSLEKSHSRY